MNNQKITTITISTDKGGEAPILMVKIRKTTYRIQVHFSATRRETMSDKIERILRNKVQQA